MQTRNIIDDFKNNYWGLSDSVKGAAPHDHILWAAALVTLFERLERWITNDPQPVGRALPPKE